MDQRETKIREDQEAIGRAVNGDNWDEINKELTEKSIDWYEKNIGDLVLEGSEVRKAYTLLLLKYLKIDPEEVPIVHEDKTRIVWRTTSWCPVIEACERGGFDTREVCKKGFESSVQAIIERLNPRLRFSRNYDRIRPHSDYCEEVIELIV
jgi:tRNA(adenine34) deaminase